MRGNPQKLLNLAVLRGPDPAAEGFSEGHSAGLQNRHDEGSVLMRIRGAVSGNVEAAWDARWQLFYAQVCTLLLRFRSPPLPRAGASFR